MGEIPAHNPEMHELTYAYEGALDKVTLGMCSTFRAWRPSYAGIRRGDAIQAHIKDPLSSGENRSIDCVALDVQTHSLEKMPALLQLLNEFNPWDENQLMEVMPGYYPHKRITPETDFISITTLPQGMFDQIKPDIQAEVLENGIYSQNPKVRELFLRNVYNTARQFSQGEVSLLYWVDMLSQAGLVPEQEADEWVNTVADIIKDTYLLEEYEEPEEVAYDILTEPTFLAELVGLDGDPLYARLFLGLHAA